MIEKREAALAKQLGKPQLTGAKLVFHHDSDDAVEAMRILGIIEPDPAWPKPHPRNKVALWASQTALRRPGSRKFVPRDIDNINKFTAVSSKLRWPRGRSA